MTLSLLFPRSLGTPDSNQGALLSRAMPDRVNMNLVEVWLHHFVLIIGKWSSIRLLMLLGNDADINTDATDRCTTARQELASRA